MVDWVKGGEGEGVVKGGEGEGVGGEGAGSAVERRRGEGKRGGRAVHIHPSNHTYPPKQPEPERPPTWYKSPSSRISAKPRWRKAPAAMAAGSVSLK